MPRLSPAELAHRKTGMGSTDCVEACGLSPWEGAGPMRLYMAKTSEDPDDEPDTRDELDWGHVMEPIILQWYERETNQRCLPGGHVPHREHEWLWATLDAIVLGGDRIVEIKNVGANMGAHWDTYAEDGVPRYVRAQVMIGMACTGKRLADVVASVGGRPPHIWTVAWDEEIANLLIGESMQFWARCVQRMPPPLDHTPASKGYLRRKYPCNADRVIVEASSPAEMIGQARMLAAREAKRLAKDIDRLDAELLEMVGDHDGLQGESWKMTWRTNKNGKRVQRFTAQGDSDG
jgi:putative phage-type endonuclease